MLITKRNSLSLKHRHDPKAFIEHSSEMDDIYKNIGKYFQNGKCKILLIFEDIISDMLNNTTRIIYYREIKKKHFPCSYCTILFH